VLLVPAVTLLAVVSAQTEFNIHLRYVYPSLALTTIFLGQSLGWPAKRWAFTELFRVGMLGYFALSCLFVYPHHLAYFNEFVGGSKNGYRHLLGSSFDWGQDLLLIRDAMQSAELGRYKCVLWRPHQDNYDPEFLGVTLATTVEQRNEYDHIIVSYDTLTRPIDHEGDWNHPVEVKPIRPLGTSEIHLGLTHKAFRSRFVESVPQK
jgi:hypothetical protein